MNWKFKKDAKKQGSSDGFWYDINNGYIEPEVVLKDENQLETLEEVLEVIRSFESALEKAGLVIEF